MTEQPPQPPVPQQPPEGWVATVAHFVTHMSLTQVLILALLMAILIPSYLVWRALNDPAMLGRFLSSYEEITSDKIPCILRIASLQGGGDQFAISSGFAAQGSDQWVVSVIMDRRPSETEIASYCETIQLLIDYMRRPDAPAPTFPDSEDPMIWRYPPPP
jgi:hypothetical protein